MCTHQIANSQNPLYAWADMFEIKIQPSTCATLLPATVGYVLCAECSSVTMMCRRAVNPGPARVNIMVTDQHCADKTYAEKFDWQHVGCKNSTMPGNSQLHNQQKHLDSVQSGQQDSVTQQLYMSCQACHALFMKLYVGVLQV